MISLHCTVFLRLLFTLPGTNSDGNATVFLQSKQLHSYEHTLPAVWQSQYPFVQLLLRQLHIGTPTLVEDSSLHLSMAGSSFLQPTQSQSSLHTSPALKHSQYFLRQLDLRQVQGFFLLVVEAAGVVEPLWERPGVLNVDKCESLKDALLAPDFGYR